MQYLSVVRAVVPIHLSLARRSDYAPCPVGSTISPPLSSSGSLYRIGRRLLERPAPVLLDRQRLSAAGCAGSPSEACGFLVSSPAAWAQNSLHEDGAMNIPFL